MHAVFAADERDRDRTATAGGIPSSGFFVTKCLVRYIFCLHTIGLIGCSALAHRYLSYNCAFCSADAGEIAYPSLRTVKCFAHSVL